VGWDGLGIVDVFFSFFLLGFGDLAYAVGCGPPIDGSFV
jgi:hypothetical protein